MPIRYTNHPPTLERMKSQNNAIALKVLKIMLASGAIAFLLSMLGIMF